MFDIRKTAMSPLFAFHIDLLLCNTANIIDQLPLFVSYNRAEAYPIPDKLVCNAEVMHLAQHRIA